jgi:nitroreductase
MDVEDIDLESVDHVLTTTRTVRRRLDLTRPVDPGVLKECIEIALQAPTGLMGQTWHFLIVTEPEGRAQLADIYRRAVEPYNAGREVPDQYLAMVAGFPQDETRKQQLERLFESSLYYRERIHEVPVFVVACVQGRVENAGPGAQASLYASIMPAVWSLQLALRARGLGSALTTVHIALEDEVARAFGIPAGITQAALLPVAHFTGTDFKRGERLSGEACTHWNRWGNTAA